MSIRQAPAPRRVLVATDRSESADYAVSFAAEMAHRYAAELLLLQVVVPRSPPAAEAGRAEATRAAYEAKDLERLAEELAGERGRAQVVVDDDPSAAIVEAAEAEGADIVVVGNAGMHGRREFLLGNVPNRVSHNARCTVVIVNSTEPPPGSGGLGRLLWRGR